MKPFTNSWFADKLGAAIRSADRRYTPNAHVALPINRNFHWLGRTEDFHQEWQELYARYEKQCDELYVLPALAKQGLLSSKRAERFEKRLKALSGLVRGLTPVGFRPIAYSGVAGPARSILHGLEPIETTIWDLQSKARLQRKSPQATSQSASSVPQQQTPSQQPPPQAEKKLPKLSESDIEGLLHQVREIIGLLWNTLRLAEDYLARLSNQPTLLLIGEAGIGKTHLLCDLAKQRLKGGYPTVLVLADQLSTMTDPLQAVIGRLGLTMNNEEFLRRLNTIARRRDKRALILVDAINESDRQAWKKGLPGILEQCRKYPGVGLVLSCRSPFHLTTVPRRAKINRLTHQGYRERELEAVRKYFLEYNLRLPEVPLLAGEFSNPLFLKIFCESLEHAVIKKKHARIREISSGQEGMLNVFEDFVLQRAKRVSTAFGLRPLAIWKIMKEGVAAKMAELGGASLTLPETHAVFRDQGISRGKERALVKALRNEGLLSEDVLYNPTTRKATEVVRFPYQKFSDHLIARYLLKDLNRTDPAQSLAPGTVLGDLLAPSQGVSVMLPIFQAGAKRV